MTGGVHGPSRPTLRKSCASASLEQFTIKNYQPDTNPKHDFGFQTLQDQVNQLFLPLGPTQHDVCTTDDVNPVTILVTLKLSLRTQSYRKASKTLRSRLDGHAGSAAVDDADTLKITLHLDSRGIAADDDLQ